MLFEVGAGVKSFPALFATEELQALVDAQMSCQVGFVRKGFQAVRMIAGKELRNIVDLLALFCNILPLERMPDTNFHGGWLFFCAS